MTDHPADTLQRFVFRDPVGASFRKTEELNRSLARMVEEHNRLTRMPEIHSARALHEHNERVSRMQNVMEQLREAQARAEAEAREAQSAAGCVRRLEAQIRLFESQLDAEHDVGIRLVSFGSEITFHVTDIASVEPDLIVFSGKTQAGAPVRLIQQRSQVDFLLTTLERSDPGQPKRPVGFHHQ